MSEPSDNIETRAADENSITNLHVLIYNKNGQLIGKKYGTGTTLTVNTRSGLNCTIYAIANTGNASLFDSMTQTETELNSRITGQVAAWNDLTNATNLLMMGKKTGVDIVAGNSTMTGSITLTRLTAKIVFALQVKSGSGITINNYQICGLPRQSYYIAKPTTTETIADDAGNTAPGSDAAQTSNASHWISSPQITVKDVSASNTFYMYENRRGVNTAIASQKDKSKSNAPDSATYVLINGEANGYKATWRVYLGANNTSNFNIKRNCTYTYTITLSRNDADSRVNVSIMPVITGPSSNCYIMKPWSAVTIPVARANESTIQIGSSSMVSGKCIQIQSGTTWTAEIIWQSSPNLITLSNTMGTGSSGRFTVTAPNDATQGNAVVAIRSGGNILWSWHLWITSYDGTERFSTNNSNRTWVFMDRALGATSNTPGDLSSCGLYYQWGRKDPIAGIGQTNGSWGLTGSDPIRVYNASNVLIPMTITAVSSSVTPNNLTNAVRNPTTVYYNAVGNNDWFSYSGTANLNHNLWGGGTITVSTPAAKTEFDPCPPGWRVPPYVNSISPFKAISLSVPIANYGMMWNGNYWPMSGGRTSLNGLILNGGLVGYYWSASPFNSSFVVSDLYFTSLGVANPDWNNHRSYSFPVRCVLE